MIIRCEIKSREQWKIWRISHGVYAPGNHLLDSKWFQIRFQPSEYFENRVLIDPLMRWGSIPSSRIEWIRGYELGINGWYIEKWKIYNKSRGEL